MQDELNTLSIFFTEFSVIGVCHIYIYSGKTGKVKVTSHGIA